MKRKTIEKVPYLTAKKCSRRSIKFVAAVGFRNIEHERHLFLEIYENSKSKLRIPIYRFIYTKKDWGNYQPESGKWSACRMKTEYGELIWESRDRSKATGEETFLAREDIDKIKRFAGFQIWNEEHWWEYFEGLEERINNKRRRAKEERALERLNERKRNVPELPTGFEGWYKELFRDANFLYYKRKGRYATFQCSHCGKSYTVAIKQKNSFEGQFEHIEAVPRDGETRQCDICHTVAKCKPEGRASIVYEIWRNIYVGQRYKDTGAVIRYFRVSKFVYKDRAEEFSVVELTRDYYESGKEQITDYHLYNGYTGKNEWHDHNGGYWGSNISQEKGYLYPGSLEELKGTVLQYSGIAEYMKGRGQIKVARYMGIYQDRPQVEMLAKLGMYELVDRTMEYGVCAINLNLQARHPAGILRIRRDRMKDLIQAHGSYGMLKVLQTEEYMNASWTEAQRTALMQLRIDRENLKFVLRYMTLQKFLNRIEKYAGVTFENTRCAGASGWMLQVKTTYLDYLRMREQCGYDLHNGIYQYPRDLEAEHNKMVLETNQREMDKRLEDVKIKYPNIKKKYRSLRGRYFFEDDELVIRPARSAEEIVMEGRILHHCVGGDNYLEKHNDGRSYILMLRNKKKPEMPYITVEIQDNRIVQWYGERDTKPDREYIQEWLDAYTEYLEHPDKGTAECERIVLQQAV